MAHKLASGNYRHMGVLIVKSGTVSWEREWMIRWVGNTLNKEKFATLKQACDAIDDEYDKIAIRDEAEEQDYYAELERGYSQDRI